MQIYARPFAYRHKDQYTVFKYTLNKEYLIHQPEELMSYNFLIEDDNGHQVGCWWNGDPEVLWERIER